jgi:hypothetical protein
MKQIGKVIEFDGFSGALVSKDGIKHIFSNSDLTSKDLKINDLVTFDSELYKTIEIELYIARYVKKTNI